MNPQRRTAAFLLQFGPPRGGGGAKPPAIASAPPSLKRAASVPASSSKKKKKGADADIHNTVLDQRSASGSEAGAGQDTFCLDGRGQRLQAAASEILAKVKSILGDINFGEDQVGIACLAGEALHDFHKALSDKASGLAQAKGDLRSLTNRIARSTNTRVLANERDEANALQAKVDAMIMFVNIMKGRRVSDLEKAISVTEEVHKPYQLKLVDMRVQYAFMFGDVEAACKMMTVGANEIEALQHHCTREELVSVASAACEGIVMDMFKDAKHKPQTGAMEVSAEHCAQMDTTLACAAQRSEESEFLASGFVAALGVVASIVQCRRVSVSRLHAAIHKLEDSAELGVDTSCGGCALLQFLLGKGKAFYMAAARVLEDRKQELLHEQLVNDMVVAGAKIVSRIADGLRPDEVLTLLDDAEKLLSDVRGKAGKARKKKGEPSLTDAQKYTLQVESDKVVVAVSRLAGQELSKRVAWAMQLCEEARLNGGYVASCTGNQEGAPMHGLVKLTELKARLFGEDLIGHAVWKATSGPDAGLANCQRHQQMSVFMYRMLAFALARMPAYENLQLELPSDGLWPDWEGLRKWLMVDLPAEMLAQWDAQWAGPMQQANDEAVTKASERIKALFAECVAGRPVGIDSGTVEKILAPFPENDPITQFLQNFFAAVIAYAAALASGSLATATQLFSAKTKLGQAMQAWPQAPGSQLHELCGLADPELKKWAADALAKVRRNHWGSLSDRHKELESMVAKAAKLIDRVPTDDEDKFREKMRTCGNAIGTAQSHIRYALACVKKADPGIDDEQAATEAVAGEDPGQTLRASFSAGTRMDDLCYYYTCLYVGLTLFHSAAISNDRHGCKLEQ